MAWRRKKQEEEVEEEEVEELPAVPKKVVVQKRVAEKLMVVDKLPELATRRFQGEDGTYNLITVPEAMEEILLNTRRILKIAEED